MFKLLLVCACAFLAVQAAPKPGVLAYSAPVVAAAPFATATSHQVIARNYNGVAAVAPVAYTAPAVAYSSPLVAPALAARYAYAHPYAPAFSPYVASPYVF